MSWEGSRRRDLGPDEQEPHRRRGDPGEPARSGEQPGASRRCGRGRGTAVVFIRRLPFAVRFEVTQSGVFVGLPRVDEDTTNEAGNAFFTYTNEIPGTDTITACTNTDETAPVLCEIADVSGTATKEWELP